MVKKVRKAVFPAAGLGTRFLPATKASPKEMLPIVDKPMIQYAVEEAEACNIKEFIMITGKSKRAIEDHFDYAWELEETLKSKGKKTMLKEIQRLAEHQFAYIRQGAPLGLGHAILCSKPFVKDEPFAVILSDDIIDPDDNLLGEMIKIYNKYKATVLALQRVPKEEIHRYGVIAGKEVKKNVYKISDMVEKPTSSAAPSDLAIIGRYILTPDIFNFIEKTSPGKGGEIQLTDALKALLKRKPVYGYLFEGRRYDGGDKIGYLKATVELAMKNPALRDEFKEYLFSRILSLSNKEQ
ncbi:MAG TPA: UTP--glucose-1-phosphate uridylyltransferase GalU [Nitrospirae bacterium]|nr:UTP--glucose-1-phosphate uridylyltransferase [bacterium BMS3Abin06]HDH12954.1 UTP--glucose-1-phosphate uridylyltransferase GalU [Nitrospirota bacterium]HDZ00442.1 UTP--glucose-1-phosphate uridylyltransferase GalU [Nitrospirota bacterium]